MAGSRTAHIGTQVIDALEAMTSLVFSVANVHTVHCLARPVVNSGAITEDAVDICVRYSLGA